jgi:hypothetical protein
MTMVAAMASTESSTTGGARLPLACRSAAQEPFDRGLFLLHNMMYSQARTAFEETAKADATCAMAPWGLAMTWFWPLWSGQPTKEALTAGAAAVEQARALATSERDKAYAAAVAGYYEAWESTDTATRLKHWEASQRALAERFPEDFEAQTFWALSLIATADRYDKTYAQQDKAAKLLEGILAKRPEHPGALHALVHANDNPAFALRAVAVADAYKDVAPSAPHALHMPSHIYVRLGQWEQVIQSNAESERVAREQPAPGGAVSRDVLHASDYLVYAYLQIGDDAKAAAVLARFDPAVSFEQNSGPGAYALAAGPARYAIERGDWKEAARLPARQVPYSWDKFPWAEAAVFTTRALGAARSGSLDAARREIASAERLQPLVESAWWRERIAIERDVALAWIARRGGEGSRALEILRAAARRELAAGKEATEPGHVIHAAEQLGDLLLEMGKPAEALAAYEAALADSPRRFNSLLGAGKAAEAAKLPEKARVHYAELVKMSVANDRPGFRHAVGVVGRR